MAAVLFILYTITLAFQFVLLVRAVKYPIEGSWIDLFATECISALAALLLFFYYESLTSHGPGLTFLAESFCSLIAFAIFTGMLAISAIIATRLHGSET